MTDHLLRQVKSGYTLKSRVVLDLLGYRDLSADQTFFKQDRIQSGPLAIETSRETRRPAPHDDHLIIFLISHGLPYIVPPQIQSLTEKMNT